MEQWLVLLGLGTGTFGTLVGTGGGIIMVPMLLLFFDLEPEVVAGTSLSLVAVSSFSGSLAYRRLGLIDRRSGLLFAAASIPGSLLAPFVVAAVTGDLFRVLFGLLIFGLAVSMAIRPRFKSLPSDGLKSIIPQKASSRRITSRRGQVYEYSFNEPLATSVNLVIGFVSTFFGTGGGFLRTPLLVVAFSFPVLVAVATSVFALSIYATVGSVVHAALGHVDWYPTFVLAGAGLLAGSQIGARLAPRIETLWILRLLTLLLFIMGVRLVIEGLFGI